MTRRSFMQTLGAIVGAALLPWANPTRKATLIRCWPRTCHWTGLHSADFDDPRNWQDGDAPVDGDSVVVNTHRPMMMGEKMITITRLDIFPNAMIGISAGATVTSLYSESAFEPELLSVGI